MCVCCVCAFYSFIVWLRKKFPLFELFLQANKKSFALKFEFFFTATPHPILYWREWFESNHVKKNKFDCYSLSNKDYESYFKRKIKNKFRIGLELTTYKQKLINFTRNLGIILEQNEKLCLILVITKRGKSGWH